MTYTTTGGTQGALRAALFEALESTGLRGETYELLAQPIVTLPDGAVSHRELLMRLQRRSGARIPMVGFGRAVRTLGLEGELDRWVATRAVELLQPEAEGPQLEINISLGSALDPAFADWLSRQVGRRRASSDALILEVDDSYLLGPSEFAEFAAGNFQLAVHFTLREFEQGGFSLLERLGDLPFSLVKLDIDFIRELDHSKADQAIVRRAAALVSEAGRTSLAIGVERPEVVPWLTSAGVGLAQGWLFGAPVPILGAADERARA